MSHKKRIVALVLVLVLCHVVFSSMGALLLNASHENCGECCLICSSLDNFEKLAKLNLLFFLAELVSALFFTIVLKALREKLLDRRTNTLFSLGVALLD